MSQPLKLAVAGLGLVGRRHAEAIVQLAPLVQLSAVVDPDEQAKNAAEAFGVPFYPSLEAMFAEHTPDGVVLSTPTLLHGQQGLMCVERGCPVLVEKPIASSAAEALPLVAAAEARKVPLLVGHHRRYNPLITKAKEILETGALGEIRAVHSHCWFYKPDGYFEAAPWRKKKGAGPILVNLVHDVDLIRYLCGEITSVQALAVPSRRGFDNEDVAVTAFGFDNGAVGTLSVSDSIVAPWSWELTSGEHSVYPQTSESCYRIGGSLGALSLPDLTLWRHEKAPNWWNPISAMRTAHETSDPLINQTRHFAYVIRGEAEPLVSGREGLKTLRVVEAIQNAAARGERIVLTPLPEHLVSG